MVHHGWTHMHALMFKVASVAALADARMKRRRLPLEKRLIVGMTCYALDGFNPMKRRVTR
jgi:hypothetical protein